MSKTHWIVVLSMSLGLGWAMAVLGEMQVGEPHRDAAKLTAYNKPNGDSYFALSLSPTIPAPKAAACDVVVLFDTSASQTGDFRDKALAALDSMLAGLGAADRVQLIAVDLNAVPLTEGKFLPAAGEELKRAVAALRQRVPLGSTDMPAALSAALACYDSAAKANDPSRAVVYIGDGMSTARLIGQAKLGQLVDSFVAAHAPITSFAVGPKLDSALLGALANHTGGMLAVDNDDLTAAQVGNFLAASADAPVIWPASISLPATLTELYPKTVPPLRFDRDTVLLGVGKTTEPAQVAIKADVAGQTQELQWTVQPAAANEDNAYLAELAQLAKRNGGMGLPTVGSAGLTEVARMLNGEVRDLLRLANQALAVGDLDRTEQLAGKAQAIDVRNPEAASLLSAAAKARKAGGAGPRDLKLVSHEDQPSADQPTDENPQEREGGLLREIEDRQRVLEGQIKADVQNTINQARTRMGEDAEGAINLLKLQLENVKKVPELKPELRSQLVAQIETALREGQRRAFEQTERELARQKVQAELDSRVRMLQDLVLTQTKIEGLINRANGLVDEGRYRDAEEAALAARDLSPNTPALTSAVLTIRNIGYTEDMQKIVERRWRGVVDTLAQVELSHIPTPDEPPIIYPEAEQWILMTERRRKWKDMISLYEPGSSEARINEQLNSKTECDFTEQPLNEVVEYFKARHDDIPIRVDQKALTDEGVDSSVPVTAQYRGITLKSALRNILSDLNLTYIIKDEFLVITTKVVADEYLTTRVYPVADLVIPVTSLNVGGGLGGLGGGVGGGIGGGGGFGGGGGLGGGGGGGFGGGGFNVADDPQNVTPQGSGGAMDVNDDLTLTSEQAAAKPSSAAPSEPPSQSASSTVAADSIHVSADVDPDTFWSDYFATLPQPDERNAAEVARKRDAALRSVAKDLMNQKKFTHVTALINAALRSGNVQPWMYEALALAMQASGQPKEEIERVLMSAVDFAKTPSDVMQVAVYMARSGLDARALKLLKEASSMEPFRHEPYMHGLQIAERLADAEGIRWAALGVLSQAWPNDKQEIVDSARFAAAALLKTLAAEGKTADAAQLKKALEEAETRDCVVKVSWTGDADIDISVQEPSGEVCSFRLPRTTGGGLMMGDSYAKTNHSDSDTCSESYVLPKGFSGQYKLLLRRVWGRVATGKVTVDIYTHYGTSPMTHHRQQIPLSERDALVTFDLSDGRRTEPLAQAQLAQAAGQQAAVNRAVLAQQFDALDSSSGSSFPPGSNPNGVVNPANPLNGFFLRGAVGYQVVPTILSEGPTLYAVAVISADRRYVRIEARPIFSTIGQVDTFNVATGQQSSGGGTGTGTGQ